MKILYLHQYFTLPSEAGGTRSYEMARRLVAWGHEVHMITSTRKAGGDTAPRWTQTQEAGIHVHWFPIPYSNEAPYRDRIRAFLKFSWKAARKTASLKGDVVFATSTPLTIALPGVYAARQQKIPMVFEVRDLWPELPIAIGALKGRCMIAAACWLERFAYRNATNIVALSPGMKVGIVKTGYPEARVHVIPNGADLEFFDAPPELGLQFRYRFEWLKERPLVVYTGTIGLMNGVDYLARLAAKVQEMAPEICFVITGEGGRYHDVRKVAGELGVLNRNFFMIGSLPKSEIPAVLSAANLATSVFINLPEMWTNSANKFFDALASGTPVAINYRGWQADLLEETGAGIVLSAEDIERAADQLVQALRDQQWLKRAGDAARRLAEERFCREHLARELEAVLLDALRKDRVA